MTGKQLIVNSHYRKNVYRARDCPLKDRSDEGGFCKIVHDIFCGWGYEFPCDCPLEDWEDKK